MKHPTVTQPEWRERLKTLLDDTLEEFEGYVETEENMLKEDAQFEELVRRLTVFIQSVADESARRERKKFIKNEIKILKQKIKDLPELIGGIDSENYELWTMVLKYYQSSLKED